MDLHQPAAEAAAGQEVVDAAEGKPQAVQGPVRGGATSWFAWTLWALAMALIVVTVVISFVNNPASLVTNLVDNVLGVPALFAYATVGAIIAARRPENPIGWIFCAAALLVAVGVFAEEYARYALVTRPGSLPGGEATAWLTAWPRNIAFTTMFTLLLLLFPTGHLPSRRWLPAAWLAAGAVALVAVVDAFKPGPLLFAEYIDNPLGIESAAGLFDRLQDAWEFIFLAAIVACAASVIARYRGAQGDERQQIKWFAYAAVFSLVQFGIILVAGLAAVNLPDAAMSALQLLAIASFPVAAGIAILKYRLYDIDLLINRTLVYLPLTGILAGLYAASIALFQKLFEALTGEPSDAAVVITTLILAASFTPIKNSLQAAVDKRFKEAPDPTKNLRAFANEVQAFVRLNSAEQLTKRLLDEVTFAYSATGGAVYLGKHGQQQLVHATENWNGDAHISVPLQGEGEPLGLVALGARSHGLDYTPEDRQTLQEIAGTVAQAIEMAERRYTTTQAGIEPE